MPECVFCEIVAGRVPSVIVDETDATLSFMDINPVNPGHVLTVPKRHSVDMWDMDAEAFAELSAVVHAVARRVRKVLHPEGVNMFMANGTAAGQTVFHAHVHTIPRWAGDGWIDPSWSAAPGDPEEIAAIGERLRASP
jgi:histidine triad (HIT) family protein